jgi:hypothetical protein
MSTKMEAKLDALRLQVDANEVEIMRLCAAQEYAKGQALIEIQVALLEELFATSATILSGEEIVVINGKRVTTATVLEEGRALLAKLNASLPVRVVN